MSAKNAITITAPHAFVAASLSSACSPKLAYAATPNAATMAMDRHRQEARDSIEQHEGGDDDQQQRHWVTRSENIRIEILRDSAIFSAMVIARERRPDLSQISHRESVSRRRGKARPFAGLDEASVIRASSTP
jgi:hypothetical protein